jgi:hypothetical protein
MDIRKLDEYTMTSREDLQKVVKAMTGDDPLEKRLLNSLGLGVMLFRGTPVWVGSVDGKPVTLNATHFGKRKKNTWEPYANWYVAYTRPDARRLGHAREMALFVRDLAVKDGCVRLKALAGSLAGFGLHASLGDQFWGLTEKDEVIVDTPIVSAEELVARGRQPFPTDQTPASARQWVERLECFSVKELEAVLQMTKFRYDK